jgi:hypothetical protein
MSDQIFLLQDNDELVTLNAAEYDAEKVLQILLAKYPNLLPIDEGDVPSLLFVPREASIPNDTQTLRFGLDHLFLDREGVPTLVEVKRASDTRIRREVVAQMLDYASHFVIHWTADLIHSHFDATCAVDGASPDERLQSFVADIEVSAFWQKVSTNLQAGRIRMLFVADHIPTELRRIVEFLNNQMNPAEVLAVEIPQFKGAGFSTYVPRLIGQTVAASEKKNPTSKTKRKWSEADFLQDLQERLGADAVAIAQRLLEWTEAQSLDVWWGEGEEYGSFVPRLFINGVKHFTFVGWSQGHIELYFQHMLSKTPFDDVEKRRALLERINQLPSVNLPKNALDRRPSIPLKTLTTELAMKHFLATWDWYLDEVRKANGW